jgi:hypothetical protein
MRSRLSRQYGILNISQLYRRPRPVLGIALLCCGENKNVVWRKVEIINGKKLVLIYTIFICFSILLHCIVQWVLQVIFPSACSFIVLVFTVSLHVSAYIAFFRCVGYFIFVLHLIFVIFSINVTFTSYYLLFVDIFRPHTAIFRCYSILFRS